VGTLVLIVEALPEPWVAEANTADCWVYSSLADGA